ncbi:hypothetical protein [uncultured Jannaschia sp.]|uniref:hypothetical protein n=1 Tax=uncultured Jannaschia sp. TaxID=293347 RepID=UPI00262F1802|nr:hypothetical protein [uncultured Jannaschia sp.]
MRDARDIYQAHLDRVSEALWNGDFAAVADLKVYPHVIEIETGQVESLDREALLATTEAFRRSLGEIGASAYHRVCLLAEFAPDDDDLIEGRHVTYVLRGGNYVAPPFECRMALRRIDGQWLSGRIVVPFCATTTLRSFRPSDVRYGDRYAS